MTVECEGEDGSEGKSGLDEVAEALGAPIGEEQIEVLISAIEHFSYCPRQCALIHVEQVFEDNVFTVRGQLAHERVDEGDEGVAQGVRVARGIALWSRRLGLFGKADLVEFRPEGPYPVEYKVGRRHGPHADLQLCAQALCLEEMLGVIVPRGAIFYRGVRRRHEVAFDDELRRQTREAIEGLRAMLEMERLPAAPNDARCPNCSLGDVCLPAVVAERARLRGLQGALFHPYDAQTAFGPDEEDGGGERDA
ncbi:MAG: CRISPR-associated protein Cas4 [Chloroflexota bacterium]|nr:MAG: CRISPR-associated protein Cas4 [Chloroflexota bacterium]